MVYHILSICLWFENLFAGSNIEFDRAYLHPYDFTYDRVTADGHCYYYSLQQYFNCTCQELRNLVAELLEERFTDTEKNSFKQTWESFLEGGTDTELRPFTWTEYMNSIKGCAYAGRHCVEFEVLAERLNITIHVWERLPNGGFDVTLFFKSICFIYFFFVAFFYLRFSNRLIMKQQPIVY